MAGLLKTGIGSREPELGYGEPLEVLRSEEDRLTSLLGGSGGGVLSGNIGVMDPALEKATDPFEYDTAAEPGREVGARLESREVDMLLDKRRSQECGLEMGVPACGGYSASRSVTVARSVSVLKLPLGVRLRFSPVRA